jgi:hypothetical protein
MDAGRRPDQFDTVPRGLYESAVAQHKRELAERDMRLVRYRLLLEEHGISPPDTSSDELLEMWQGCRHVMTTASQFVMKLGTQKEMLLDFRAPP